MPHGHERDLTEANEFGGAKGLNWFPVLLNGDFDFHQHCRQRPPLSLIGKRLT